MIGVVLKPMGRGQITLPKKYRDKLGITPQTPLNLTLESGGIMVKPLHTLLTQSPHLIKAKISKVEYLQVLKKLAQSGKTLWTQADDETRTQMRTKEKERDKKLDW